MASLAKALLGPNRIRTQHYLPGPTLGSPAQLRESFEAAYLRRLLQATKGNVAAAARLANRPRTTFRNLLEKRDVNPNDYRR